MLSPPLAPAEAYVLLDPMESSPAETFKIAFLFLVAARVLKIGTVERRKLLRTKIVPSASVIGAAPSDALAAEIVTIVRNADRTGTGADFPDIAKSASKVFGPGLPRIKALHILPLLMRRGLLTSELRRRGWLLKETFYPHTAEGQAEKQRIDATLDRARRLPALLDSEPAEAKAIILAAGPLLLLLPEMKGYYGAFAALNAAAAPAIDGSDGNFFYDGVPDGSGDGHGHLGGVDFGAFDFGLFDASALDMDFSSFDASFDSSISDSGGDGGSDGGSSHD